jgi:hypothetical protein
MIKKLLLDLIGGTIFVYILMYSIYDWDLKPINYSNSLFIIGVVMFSAGILTVTNATRIFSGVGFVFKKMFTRKVEGLSYYEYLLQKDDGKESVQGYPLLISGIIFIAIALIIA